MLENVIEFFKNLPAKFVRYAGKKSKSSMNATAINAMIAISYK